MGWVICGICDFVSVCVFVYFHTLKGKQIELPTPNLVNIQRIMVQWVRHRIYRLLPRDYRFEPGRVCVHFCVAVTGHYDLTGKVTVGLAWHWPCFADLNNLTTYRLKADEREMKQY